MTQTTIPAGAPATNPAYVQAYLEFVTREAARSDTDRAAAATRWETAKARPGYEAACDLAADAAIGAGRIDAAGTDTTDDDQVIGIDGEIASIGHLHAKFG